MATVVLAICIPALAPAAVIMPWTLVGDAGNAPEAANPGGYGSVAAPYYISKHEVTNAQYVEFLNSKDPSGRQCA